MRVFGEAGKEPRSPPGQWGKGRGGQRQAEPAEGHNARMTYANSRSRGTSCMLFLRQSQFASAIPLELLMMFPSTLKNAPVYWDFLLLFFVFCVCHFRATPAACGGSRIRLNQSCSCQTTTATATLNLSRVFELHHSSRQHRILNLLSEARE